MTALEVAIPMLWRQRRPHSAGPRYTPRIPVCTCAYVENRRCRHVRAKVHYMTQPPLIITLSRDTRGVVVGWESRFHHQQMACRLRSNRAIQTRQDDDTIVAIHCPALLKTESVPPPIRMGPVSPRHHLPLPLLLTRGPRGSP